MNRPIFGTREVYDALAETLNDDPKWLAKASVLNYTMTHVYTEPVNKTFTFRFEGGKLLDVRDVDGPAPADVAAVPGRELHGDTPNPGFIARSPGPSGRSGACPPGGAASSCSGGRG